MNNHVSKLTPTQGQYLTSHSSPTWHSIDGQGCQQPMYVALLHSQGVVYSIDAVVVIATGVTICNQQKKHHGPVTTPK